MSWMNFCNAPTQSLLENFTKNKETISRKMYDSIQEWDIFENDVVAQFKSGRFGKDHNSALERNHVICKESKKNIPSQEIRRIC